jgi:hypothetical protein
MLTKRYIITGNRAEFDQWRTTKPLSTTTDYVYVTSAYQLIGIQNPHGVFYGSWRNRDHIKEIVERLVINSTQFNPVIDGIWKSL